MEALAFGPIKDLHHHCLIKIGQFPQELKSTYKLRPV
jgi:hypothetical protein